MIARTLITAYYITCFAAYVLTLLYLIKLEADNCVKHTDLHYTVKNSIYAGLGVPVAYLVLLAFAYITKDNVLASSLKNVFHIVMVVVNGVIAISLFVYMRYLDDFKCAEIDNQDRFKKIHMTINILSYILLCFYGLYFVSYVYYKYIAAPRIILVDNIQRVQPVIVNNRNNKNKMYNNKTKMNNKNTPKKNNKKN